MRKRMKRRRSARVGPKRVGRGGVGLVVHLSLQLLLVQLSENAVLHRCCCRGC